MRAWATLCAAAAFVAGTVGYAAAEQSIVQIGAGWSAGVPFGFDAITTTTVEIRATEEPGAVAEVHYRNAPINDSATDDGRYTIAWNGIDVVIFYDHDFGGNSADRIVIFPSDGLTCRPSCELLLQEASQDTIYLIESATS